MGGKDRTKSKETIMNNYIVWDLETTGLQKETSEIIEIGLIHVKDNEVVKEQSWLINHDIPISSKTTEITGITQEMIDTQGIEPQQAITEFIDILMSEEHNITHNGMKFDIPWLLYHLQKHLYYNHDQIAEVNVHLQKGMIDTAVMVKGKKLNKKQRAGEEFRHYAYRVMEQRAKGIRYNLGLCCREMGIDIKDQHRALADVKMTHEVYKKLIQNNK